MTFRTDRNNNPAAFTTDIAAEAGLVQGSEYVQGDAFLAGNMTLYTAKLLGDPIALTIKVLDKIGYYTKHGVERWIYMAIPTSLWDMFTLPMKKQAILEHYRHEGGTELMHLWPTPVNATVGSAMKIGDSVK